MTSHILKQSENIFPPVIPKLKSKSRILSTVTNKDDRGQIGLDAKTALQRQRENAAKLASGRSVVARAEKENEISFKKPIKDDAKAIQKPKKVLQPRKEGLKKSDSCISLNNIHVNKVKEKEQEVHEFKRPVSKIVTICTDEPKQKEVTIKQKEKVQAVEHVINKTEESEEKIPLGVNIIDEDDDGQNEFALGAYATDIYKYLRVLEEQQNIRKCYLTAEHIMTEHMRSLLVDWIFDVQQSFHLLNETAQISIALLDRFMQDHPGIIRDELQLVAVTCLFLASKYEEVYPPDLDDFIQISADTYTKAQILKMEQVIYSSIGFQMGRPVPALFLRRIGKAGSVDLVTYSFSKYFTELSLIHYELCHVRPSLLAAASLYLSLYLTSDDSNFWTPTLEYYSTYSAKDLKPLVSVIASIVIQASTSKYQNVPKKYLNPKCHGVSARPELKSEKLKKIGSEIVTSL